MEEPLVIPESLAQKLRDKPHLAPVFDERFGAGTSEGILGVRPPETQGVVDEDIPAAPGPKRDRTVLGKVWNNTFGAVGYGAQEAVNETLDTFESFDEWAGITLERIGVPAYIHLFDKDGTFNPSFKHRSEIIEDKETSFLVGQLGVSEDGLEFDLVEAPENLPGQLVAGLSQFATGYITAGKILKVGGLLGSFVKGGVADAVVFDPNDKNISAMLHDLGIAPDGMAEILATDPDDPEWINRVRNVAEGAIAGGLVEALSYAVRARKLAAKGRAEEAADAMASAVRYADEVENGFMRDLAESARKEAAEGLKLTKKMFDDLEGIDWDSLKARGADFELSVPGGTKRPPQKLKWLSSRETEIIRKDARLAADITPENLLKDFARSTRKSFERVEDIKDYLAAVRVAYSDEWMKGGNKPQTNAQIAARSTRAVKEMAELLGEDPQKLYERFKSMGEVPFEMIPGELVGRSRLVGVLAEELDELAENMARNRVPSKYRDFDAMQADWDHKVSLAKALAKPENEAWSTVGRTLQARRIATKGTAEQRKMLANPMFTENGLASAKAWAQARATGKPPIPAMEKVGNFITNTLRRVNAARINFLLSGPGTQEVNFLSNMVNMIAIPTQQIVGGAITALSGAARLKGSTAISGVQSMQDGLRTIQGMAMSAFESIDAALKAWDAEDAILDPQVQKVEGDIEVKKITGMSKIDQTVRLPSRLLLTMDELFKQSSYRGVVFADAARIAKENNLKGADRAKFIKGYIQKRFDPETGMGIDEGALRQARRVTFTEPLEPGSFGAMIQKAAIEWPLARMIVPFVRTPMNLLSTAWQHMPVAGATSKRWRDDIAAGGNRRAQALGKQAIGMSIVMGAMSLAGTGQITGSGPKDPRIRKVWLKNNKPYSIRIDQPDGSVRWWSYARFEPMAQILAIAADMHEITTNKYENFDEQGFGRVAGSLVMAVGENTVNKTFTQGIYDFMKILMDPNMESKQRAFTNFVSSFVVPNFINQMNSDEAYRETRTIVDAIWSKGWKYDEVDPRRDILGEVVYRPSPKFDPMNVMYEDRRDVDPVMAKISELAIINQTAFSAPSRFVQDPMSPQGRVDLSTIEYKPGQSLYDAFLEKTGTVKIGGRTLRQALEKLIESRNFKLMPQGSDGSTRGTQMAQISKVISQYRRAAKAELPELQQIERDAKYNVFRRNKSQYQRNRELFPKTNKELERSLILEALQEGK